MIISNKNPYVSRVGGGAGGGGARGSVQEDDKNPMSTSILPPGYCHLDISMYFHLATSISSRILWHLLDSFLQGSTYCNIAKGVQRKLGDISSRKQCAIRKQWCCTVLCMQSDEGAIAGGCSSSSSSSGGGNWQQ